MYRTFSEIQTALKEGKTVEEIVNYYLANIQKRESLNAFIEVFETSALEKAKEVDQKLKDGTAGRLAGMVIGIKDNIAYKDHKVSASSKMLDGYVSVYSATAIERLLAEDAVIIGRLNSDEFSMGSTNKTSYYGPVKNPINEDYVPGGSSGGSAAAVAGNLCTAALGSDTGGSIRQPASFTGTVGLKPTYGRISRYGLIAYASSFDQISSLANNLEDVALLTEIMAGADEYDSTVSSREVPSLEVKATDKKLKFAYMEQALEGDNVDSTTKEEILNLIQALEAEGHEVTAVPFKYMDQLVPTYYVLTCAEASSNLSRYDGVHFGYRSADLTEDDDIYVKSRTEGFGEEVKRRIITGNYVLARDQYEDYYVKAQKVRRLIQESTNEMLDTYDVLLLPTAHSVAFKLNEEVNPVQMYMQDVYTVQANLTGHPAISFPLAKNADGMPFGIQLIGKAWGEKNLLDTSAYLMNLINEKKLAK